MEHESAAVSRIEAGPPLLITVEVDVEVVPDDVDRSRWVERGNVLHVAQEVVAFPCVTTLGDDTPFVHLECAQERLRAMAAILEFSPSWPAWSRWLVRESALEGLHPRLLVDAQHHRTGGRIEVQLDDLRHLLPK